MPQNLAYASTEACSTNFDSTKVGFLAKSLSRVPLAAVTEPNSAAVGQGDRVSTQQAQLVSKAKEIAAGSQHVMINQLVKSTAACASQPVSIPNAAEDACVASSISTLNLAC